MNSYMKLHVELFSKTPWAFKMQVIKILFDVPSSTLRNFLHSASMYESYIDAQRSTFSKSYRTFILEVLKNFVMCPGRF